MKAAPGGKGVQEVSTEGTRGKHEETFYHLRKWGPITATTKEEGGGKKSKSQAIGNQ